jgi:hypothetical protein
MAHMAAAVDIFIFLFVSDCFAAFNGLATAHRFITHFPTELFEKQRRLEGSGGGLSAGASPERCNAV